MGNTLKFRIFFFEIDNFQEFGKHSDFDEFRKFNFQTQDLFENGQILLKN